MTETKCFQVFFPIEGNRETLSVSGKQAGNFKETISLKALANKVLQGNHKETSGKLPVSTEGNFKGQVSTVGNSVSSAGLDTMKQEYQSFADWLSEIYLKYDFDYRLDIEKGYPSAHKAIQQALRTMDDYMTAGNLQGFRKAMQRLKDVYLNAVREVSE